MSSGHVGEPDSAADELERSRRDLEDFFENGTVALHWVASDGSILRVNQAELDLLGYTREEYVGRQIADFHADRPVIDDILARLTRGERLDKYEARLKAKDGSIKHVLISSNVQFRDGRFINTRCFTLDVTELKKSEQALRESEQRLRATHDRAFAGIAEEGPVEPLKRLAGNRGHAPVGGAAVVEIFVAEIQAR